MNIVAAVYSHPEYYPPTLNAISQLSKHAEKIFIVSRNVKSSDWNYPLNVELKKSGKFKSIRDSEKSSLLWKVASFLQFCRSLYKIIHATRPEWVICYDPFPLLAYRIISIFILRKPKIWYHNHDVLEVVNTGSFSIGRLAIINERNYLNKVTLFSLPANERKKFFRLDNFNGQYFFLPNYPSIAILNERAKLSPKEKEVVALIFQGSIGYDHGYEEILAQIPALNSYFDKSFKLVLKGFITPEFTAYIKDVAKKYAVSTSLEIIGVGPYLEIFELSSKCDIGLAIHKGQDTMNKTLGTSSNKIYEYAAVGLPVLLYDNEHFKSHLAKRTWAFFSDLTQESMIKNLDDIFENYNHISKSALKDFKEELNFESYFEPIILYLLKNT